MNHILGGRPMALQGIPRFSGKISIVVTVPDAAEAAAFYTKAFGGEEIARFVLDRHPPSVGPVKAVTMQIGEACRPRFNGKSAHSANDGQVGRQDPKNVGRIRHGADPLR
jgi:catechol 2,3-dioxygenase-like lactoylglutathione lyase family enzyme